jgi:hypothetical protein
MPGHGIVPDPPPMLDARTVAVFLREAEWLLADAAHRMPTGDYGSGEQTALADALDQLARALRRHAGQPAPAARVDR